MAKKRSGGSSGSRDEVTFERAAEMVREKPGSVEGWDALEEHAAGTQHPDEVSALYRELLATTLPADVASWLGDRAVKFHEEWFGEDSPVLVDVLRRVLEIAPDSGAFQRLTVLFTVAERWDDLLSLYDVSIAAAPTSARREELLEEAYQTARDFAGRPERAIDYLGQLRLARPEDATLVQGLERLLEKQERWRDLVALWREGIEGLTPVKAFDLHVRIAELLLARLGVAREALEELTPLLALEGIDVDPALRLLERIVGDESAPSDCRHDAMTLLRRRYKAEGRTSQLALTLDTALQFADREEQVELHLGAAERCEEAGESAKAMDHLAAVLAIDPEHVNALARIGAIAERSGAHAALVRIYTSTAERADGAKARIRLRRAAADVLRERLGDAEAAIELYGSVLAEPDATADDALAAAGWLAALYGETGQKEAQLEMLERAASLEKEPSRRRSLLGEVARLAQSLEQTDRAINAWEARLAERADDAEALEALIDLLEASWRWNALVSALERRLALPAPPWLKRADLVRIATLQWERLESAPDAIATWRDVAERFGEDADVVDALTALYTVTERWDELAALLGRATAREDAHLAVVRARLGDTLHQRLGRPEDAVFAYRRSLESDPRGEQARAGLAALCEVDAVRAESVEALARSYRDTDEWEPLLALLDQRLAVAPDAGAQLVLLREAAALQRERGGAPAAALGTLRRAFALAPSDLGLEAELVRLAEQTEEWAVAALALAEGADVSASDPGRQAHLRARAAGLLEEKVGDAAGALALYAGALDAQPRRLEVAQAVVRTAAASGDWGRAEAALGRAAALDGATVELLALLADVQRRSPGEPLFDTLQRLAALSSSNLDVLIEAATLARATLHDEERALGVTERLYERAVALFRRGAEGTGRRPASEVALEALEELVASYSARGKHARAVALLQEGAALPVVDRVSVAFRRRAAAMAAEQLGDRGRAIDLYRDVLVKHADDIETMGALGELYEAERRYAELLTLRQKELEKTQDPERRLQTRLAIVRLVTEVEKQSGRVESLRQNLRERPGHEPTIEAFAELLTDLHRHRELADMLAEQAGQVEPERASAMWRRIATLAEGPLADTSLAISAYRRVVDLEASPDALRALARIHTERGEHVAASRWLERLLASAPDAERTDVALELCRSLTAGGRGTQTVPVLEDALARDPANTEVRRLLAEQYRAAGSHGPLARLLTDSASRSEDPEQVRALVGEASVIFFDTLHEPALAIQALERGLSVDPDDRDLRSRLAEAYRDAGRLEEARDALQQIIDGFGRRRSVERAEFHFRLGEVVEAMGEHERALDEIEQATKMAPTDQVMLHRLGAVARAAGQPDRAEKSYRALLMIVRRREVGEPVVVGMGEVLFELSAIAESRGEADKAAELLASAVEAATQSDGEALRFEKALLTHGKPELALSALEGRLAVAESASSKAELLSAMAEVLDVGLGRAKDALTRRLEALAEAPDDAAGHAATADLARRLGAIDRYVEVVEGLVDRFRREEDIARVGVLLVHLAGVVEKDLGDLERSDALLRRAEEAPSVRLDAWRAHARVAAKRGDGDTEREVLRKLVEVPELGDAERVDTLYRLAAAQVSVAEERDAGVATLKAAFAKDPQYERAGAILGAAAHADPDHEGVMGLYQSVARGSGDDALLLGYLERRSARADATMLEVREAAERAEALGRRDLAEQLLERAVAVAEAQGAGPAEARWALLALSDSRAKGGDIPGAIAWMQRAVATANGADAVALELQLAHFAAQPGGDLAVAAEAYERLRGPDPMNRAMWAPLLDVYAKMGAEDRLNDLVNELIEGLLDPSLRNEARLAKAHFLIGLEGREYDAVDVLKAVLEEEPERTDAGELLATLYEKVGYDEDLVDLLARQLDVARDARDLEGVSALSLRLGALLEKVERADALEVYRRCLDLVPTDRPVIEALLSLLGPEDNPRERIEVSERLLALEEGDAASELAWKLYTDWEALEDQEGMLRALELGHRGNPEDESIRSRLEAWLRHWERWDRLADFLAREAARLAADPPRSLALMQEAAAIHTERLGNPGGAVEVLRSAWRSSRDVGILEQLVQALTASGDPASCLVDVEEALSGHPADDATRARLLLLRGRLHLALGATAEAVADLENAYALAPSQAAGALVEALAAHRGAAQHGGDEGGERAAALRLVAVLHELGDRAQARDVLAGWVAAHSMDVAALVQLRDMDLAAENWEGVSQTAAHLVQILDGEAQADAALLLADACEATRSREQARAGLEKAYRDQPHNARVSERLRMLYEELGAHRELAELLVTEAESEGADAERRFELLRRAGRVFIEGVGDHEAAIAPLRAAFGMHPDDHRVTVALVDAYTGAGRLAESGQLLEEAIANHKKPRSPELSQLQHRMARLAQVAGDRGIEMQWLNAALDSDKNNMEAASELAYLAMEFGELDLALGALRAITLCKTDGPMTRAMAFLLQARIAHQRGEGRRALLWARKARSEDPALAEAEDFLRELGDA